MEDTFVMFLTQLVWQIPLLVVYIAGLILAMLSWQRCPLACALTAAGMALLLLVTLGGGLLQYYLWRSQMDDDWLTSGGFSGFFNLFNLAESVFHAIGIGLVLIAVFVGRKQALPVAPDAARFEPIRSNDPRFRA